MSSEDIYAPPKSSAFPLKPIERMLAKQSLFGTVVGTFSAGIPAMLTYIMTVSYGFEVLVLDQNYYYLLFILMPVLGLIIGMTAQICGNGIERTHQRICGLVTLFLVIIANIFVANIIASISSILAVLTAVYFSKTRLTEQEKIALTHWQTQNGQ